MVQTDTDGARDTAGARLLDPEMRVQHARDLAWKALNRRERTVAEDRRRLDGWGAERIERRLRSLGIDPEALTEALGAQGHEEEMGAALALLRRRFPDPPATPRDCERALGMLVRKGYGLELAHDALRRHAGVDALD